jgi:hypothetical protein
MAKKNLEELAKNLGYKNFDKMKESVGNKDAGFSFMSLFGGKKSKETSPSKAGTETEATGGISEDVLPFLNVIAKNSIVLPGMARDMNVLRQNISKLVNLKGKESKVKAEGKADKFFQTEEAREAKLEEERKKNAPVKEGKDKKEPKEEKKEGGGLLSGLMDMLNPINLLKGLFMGIVGAFGALFSGGSIFAILSKIFVPAMIIGGLINGIMDGINTWKETGSITDSLISAVGGFLQFITFGLFNESDLRKGMDTALTYLNPLMLSVTQFFDDVVGWIKNNVGWPGTPPFKIPFKKLTSYDISIGGKGFKGNILDDVTIPGTPAWYPFKSNPSSGAKESYTSSATTALKENQAKLDSGQGVFYDKEREAKDKQKQKEKEAGTTPEAAGKLAEKVGTSPTKEDPYSAKNAEKDQKGAVGFLKTKLGISVDPNSSTGFIDDKTGEQLSEDAVRQEVNAVGGDANKIIDAAKGKKTSEIAPMPTAAPAASMGGGSISGGESMGGGGGAVSPSPSPESSPAVSGSALSTASSEVAEGQRMDSAADAGTVINAPMTNNQSGATGKEPENIASVYNNSFINNYMTA